MNYYGFLGIPTAVFDGMSSIGGSIPDGSMFTPYSQEVEKCSRIDSPLLMQADYFSSGDDIHLNVTVTLDQEAAAVAGKVMFFICQDGLHGQTNLLVDVLPAESLSLQNPGQQLLVQRQFTMDPDWTEAALRIITFVQDHTTKEVQQAVLAQVPPSVVRLVVDPDPDDVQAPWLLTGPLGYSKHGCGDLDINLPAGLLGDFTLTWEEVLLWTTPADNPLVLTVAAGDTVSFAGTYSQGPFSAQTDGPLADAGQGQGVALVDFDNDGDWDIHLVNDGTCDQLLRNDGQLTFTDVAAGALADSGPGRGAAWADFTQDGLLDVYIGRQEAANILLTGDGSGGFAPVNAFGEYGDLGTAESVAWVDYDLDGNLDLYVTRSNEDNLMFRGYGEVEPGTFVFFKVARMAPDIGNGRAASWVDLDLDGRPDLFLTNFMGSDRLYQNMSIGMQEVTLFSGLSTDATSSVGHAWGDFDNDGDLDLYVANEDQPDGLYENNGPFQFTPVAGMNLGDAGNGRSVVWADFDNDTHLDLYVSRQDEPDFMLLGDGAGQFQHSPVGWPEANAATNAVACGDLDGDGRVDVFISRLGQANVLLRNEIANDNHWFQIRLTGADDNPLPWGARVTVTTGTLQQTRVLISGSGYLSTNAASADFGLGAAVTADLVKIVWPDGTVQQFGPFLADQVLEVRQGEDPVSPVGQAPQRSGATTLSPAFPNPCNPRTTLEFSLASPGPVRLDIFSAAGRHVRSLLQGELSAGPHRATWDGLDDAGRQVSSGSYFYRLDPAGEPSLTGKLSLIK